jgi:TolB-like protein/Flp pilus assembly protein TadD
MRHCARTFLARLPAELRLQYAVLYGASEARTIGGFERRTPLLTSPTFASMRLRATRNDLMSEIDESANPQEARSRSGDRLPNKIPDVFVSYASQDMAIASAVVHALESNGPICWIAPRDVIAGSLYADEIIRAITDAKVMVVVLSQGAIASAHVGKEIERASSKRRPIITLRIDAAPLTAALEYFLSESHWIELQAEGSEVALGKLIKAVNRHVSHEFASNLQKTGNVSSDRHSVHRARRMPFISTIAVVAVLIIWFAADRYLRHTEASSSKITGSPTAAVDVGAAFSPPAHSIAVLPFVNMSGDPKQEYFSDGLSEELLNALATIPDLHVAAQTSTFTFKGKGENLGVIAQKLNVGSVLEGSVRRDGLHVRITAQLIDAKTGFNLWSHTYDRDLKSVLALQAEIATAVTKALQASLLSDAATNIEIGGTTIPAAFDTYLRGRKLERDAPDRENTDARIATFSEAIRLDPRFAKAYVVASFAQNTYAANFARGSDVRSQFEHARKNSETAISLAPDLGDAHAARALALERGYLDFSGAQAEYERALFLSPNDSQVLMRSGKFFVSMGRVDAGLSYIRKAIALDPLNPTPYRMLTFSLTTARRYRDSIAASERTLQLVPNDAQIVNQRGLNYLLLNDLDPARKSCATAPRSWTGRLCMAILYDRLHQRSEADAELAAMEAGQGDGASYPIAEIYAQRGDSVKALDSLETAYRFPDPGILDLKVDELIDPLRKLPRFREIERKLNFPN